MENDHMIEHLWTHLSNFRHQNFVKEVHVRMLVHCRTIWHCSCNNYASIIVSQYHHFLISESLASEFLWCGGYCTYCFLRENNFVWNRIRNIWLVMKRKELSFLNESRLDMYVLAHSGFFIHFYFIRFSRLNSISIILFWENTGSAGKNYQIFEISNHSREC